MNGFRWGFAAVWCAAISLSILAWYEFFRLVIFIVKWFYT
jgi:hypothetical protein